MKKSTKKALVVIFLVFSLFGSTFAFLIVGGIRTDQQPQEQQGQQTPARFVVDGYLDTTSGYNFLARGYTLLEFHRPDGCCPDFSAGIESLPQELDFQLVVQKIPDSRTYFLAESFRGRKEFNATDILQVIFGLCDVLAQPPAACAFRENSTG